MEQGVAVADYSFEQLSSRRPLGLARVASGRRAAVARRANPGLRMMFALMAPALDLLAIICASALVGEIYHKVYYGSSPAAETQLQMGALIAFLVVVPGLYRGEYELSRYLATDGQFLHAFKQWNIAFLCSMGFVFLTKTGATFSRGAFILFYIYGFLALSAARMLAVLFVRHLSKAGSMLARRVFLVGSDSEILSFVSRNWPLTYSLQIVGAANLSPAALNPQASDMKQLDLELQNAVAWARQADPDDVVLLLNRGRDGAVDAAIDRFLTIPASIHLGAERMLERFTDAKVSRIADISLLSLTRRPLSASEIAVKRVFDVTLSALALLALAPLAAIVAILIKIDSPGPVFFYQRRYGFNQQPFRIIKFRTMSTMEDGAVIQQARADDPRITRVGHFLRRWNIDELPQILNVLRGEMSLVGPRPHALAHDHHFMQRIALYARRHNVKPGITGWAQVNGFRGETATDDKMRGRVEHDLQYIDNWSLGLDMKIILLTAFSSRAYHNAR